MAQDTDTVETAEIRSQIEQTRVELGQTIDAIQDRLSPRRVVQDAKETISDATIGRAKRLVSRVSEAVNAKGSSNVSAVLEKARQNPTIAALIGVAVSAMALALMTRSRRPRLAKTLGGVAVSLAMATAAQLRSQGPRHW
jgi:Protein of unknown function (DUF3618)